jgi:hypothetical protein
LTTVTELEAAYPFSGQRRVAGSNAMIESLIADPRLEVWRVFAGDPVSADSDDKNI